MPKTRIAASVEIDAPLPMVYRQWSHENFPKFMRGVEEVTQVAPNRLLWKAERWGSVSEWEAEITTEIPNEVIRWKNLTDEHPIEGAVLFSPRGSRRTVVEMVLTIQGADLAGQVQDMTARV